MLQLAKIFKTKFTPKSKSKKGYTLVEALGACIVLMIIFTGVLNSVAFAQRLVYSNNSKEKASDTAQLVADELIVIARGSDSVDAAQEKIAESKVFDESDPQFAIIGNVEEVDDFSEPDGTHGIIQYILTEQGDSKEDTELDVGGETVQGNSIKQCGVLINVRVYYKRFTNSTQYDCVDLVAFAPKDYGDPFA